MLRDKLGICQWFHYEAYEDVERAVSLMRELGIRHLRTGISWADSHRPGAQAWYDWQMEQLKGFDVLLSLWHTPPSIAEGGTCASPPRRLQEFGTFVGEVIDRWGLLFEEVELWNEPNNTYKWDFSRFDPDWSKFCRMIVGGAGAAKMRGKRTVLGGMSPADPEWLELVDRAGALEDIDVVAIHGFPRMWWPNAPSWDDPRRWRDWTTRIRSIERKAGGRPVWISETGLATWDMNASRAGRHALQGEMLKTASEAPAERVYWYSLVDLEPSRSAIEGFHVDENEYHMGLVSAAGARKPCFAEMRRLLAPVAESSRRAAVAV